MCQALWPSLLWHAELLHFLRIPQQRAQSIPDLFNNRVLPYTSDMSSLRDTLERVVVVSEGEVRFPKGLSG